MHNNSFGPRPSHPLLKQALKNVGGGGSGTDNLYSVEFQGPDWLKANKDVWNFTSGVPCHVSNYVVHKASH